ncbi:hypothetical protein CR513_57568, partial [Mucuna pruriens]
MKVTLVRIQIVESQEATMTICFNGLNRDIQDLWSYMIILLILHLCIKPLGGEGYSSEAVPYDGDLLMVSTSDVIPIEATHILFGRP